jgi:hypothetical protein
MRRPPILPALLLLTIAACSSGTSSSTSAGSEGATGSSTSASSAGTTSTGTGGATGTGGTGGATTTSATGTGGTSSATTTSATGTGGAGGATGTGGTGGGGATFPDVLDDGVWLIGWSGGLDHYSWVRFQFLAMNQGTIDVLDAVGPTLTPFYSCEGMGLFSADPATGVATLQLPAGCGANSLLKFASFSPPSGFPPGATLESSIVEQGSMQPLMGYLYPSSQCDAAFTSCTSPF